MNGQDFCGAKIYIFGARASCGEEADNPPYYFAKPALDGKERGGLSVGVVRDALFKARRQGYVEIWNKDPSGRNCPLDKKDFQKLRSGRFL